MSEHHRANRPNRLQRAPQQSAFARSQRPSTDNFSSLRSKQSQFALHSPLATPLVRAHNHELKRATGIRDTSSNAGRRARVLSFVPAGSAPCGHRAAFCGYRTPLSAALSLPSRATEAPPVRKRAALSDPQGYRTLLAREGQHPKVSANAEMVRCAADAAISNVSRPASGARPTRLHQGRAARPWTRSQFPGRASVAPFTRPSRLAPLASRA